MRTVKAHISLRIRAVWSGPLLSANIITKWYERWSESAHSAHAQRHYFAWRGLHVKSISRARSEKRCLWSIYPKYQKTNILRYNIHSKCHNDSPETPDKCFTTTNKYFKEEYFKEEEEMQKKHRLRTAKSKTFGGCWDGEGDGDNEGLKFAWF